MPSFTSTLSLWNLDRGSSRDTKTQLRQDPPKSSQKIAITTHQDRHPYCVRRSPKAATLAARTTTAWSNREDSKKQPLRVSKGLERLHGRESLWKTHTHAFLSRLAWRLTAQTRSTFNSRRITRSRIASFTKGGQSRWSRRYIERQPFAGKNKVIKQPKSRRRYRQHRCFSVAVTSWKTVKVKMKMTLLVASRARWWLRSMMEKSIPLITIKICCFPLLPAVRWRNHSCSFQI